MKKNGTVIIALVCSIFSINGKFTTKMTPPPPAPQKEAQKIIATVPPQTYKQLHEFIKTMRPEQVIGKDGILTNYFVSFVLDNAKKAQLSPHAIEALLQTGRDMHAQFSGNDTTDHATLMANQKQIQDIVTPLQPKPVVQPTPPPQPIPPSQPVPPQKQSPQAAGIAALHELRKQSAQQPMTGFYAHGTVNTTWLAQALQRVLNTIPLTTQNKMQIQGELIGTATELIRELMSKNKTPSQQWKTTIDDVEQQVVAFMNAQPLQDQKRPVPAPLPSAPKSKEAAPQSAAAQPKKPVSEPGTKTPQKSELMAQRLRWISPENTLVTKEFEIELLHYIFQHPDATEQDMLTHFTKQLSATLPNKSTIINAMKIIIQKTFQEPEQKPKVAPPQKSKAPSPTPQKPVTTLPTWINPDTYDLISGAFIHEVTTFFTKNMDADNETIFNHFKEQLPADFPGKKVVEAQMKATIEAVFL